jgi:uncharacterized protein YcfL
MKTLVRIPKSILCLALGLGLLVGCTTVNTVERAEPVGQRQLVNDKRIVTDASLNRAVRIVAVNEIPGEFLKVQIELQNTTRSLRSFNYRFEWFDANGMQVNSPTSVYIPRQIEGKENLFISTTAPAPTAKDFRVKLIENTN